MGFILPLLFILSVNFILMFFLKRKLEEILPLSLMSCTLFVYIFGLFTNLRLGFYFLLIILLVCLIYILIKLKNKILSFIKSYFTLSVIIFIVVYIIVYVLNLNRTFYQWDEFSHWGPMVKEMFRLNTFYSVPDSTLYVHKNYPPIITLYETIWCFISNGYKEGYIYRSLQLLSFSMLFPILNQFSLKKRYYSIFNGIIIVLLMLFIFNAIPLEDANFYKTVYIDGVLAVMFAYGMYLIYVFDYSKFEWFRLIVTLSFLLLSKQMGIVFFLIIVSTLFIMNLLNNKLNNYKINHVNNILFLFTILIPYLFKLSWDIYIKQFNIDIQFSTSKISISSLIGIINGTSGETYQQLAYSNFINAIYTKPILTYPLELSYLHVLIIFSFIFGCLTLLVRNSSLKKKVALFGFIMISGSIAYAFVMMLLYIFNFGFYEGPILASYVRYLNTYWMACLVLILMIFINSFALIDESKSTKRLLIGLLILILGFYNKFNLAELTPAITPNTNIQEFNNDIEIIRNHTDQVGSVFIVVQKTNGYPTNILRYHLTPQRVNSSYYSLGKPYGDQDFWTANISVEELSIILKDYEYVYLMSVDDQFRYTYNELFEIDTYPNNEQLFKVIKKENQLVFLERIY